MVAAISSFGLFHLKVWGGGGGGIEDLWRGVGSNSELIYPLRLHMISDSRGVGVEFFIIFRPPSPTTLLNGTALMRMD